MDCLFQELQVCVNGTNLEQDELRSLYLGIDCPSPYSWSTESLFQVYCDFSSMPPGVYHCLSHTDEAIMTLCF